MKIRLAIIAAVFLCPSIAFAAWISPVDQKYRKKNPALYAQVAKAQALITDSYGNSRAAEEALRLAQEVVAKDPGFAPAYVQVARATGALGYVSSGKFDPAALAEKSKFLQKALALEPGYDYAMALVGYNLMAEGKLAEADAVYKRVVAMKSGYPILNAQIAHLAIERKEYSKAIEIASKGYEANKSDPKVAVSYCTELIFAYEELEGNQVAQLEKWQTTRRTLAPEVAWFWGDHARHRMFNMNDYAGAITYGEKALTLMDYGVGRYTLAAAYYAKWADLEAKSPGSKDAADSLRRAEALSPLDRQMLNLFLSRPAMVPTGVALSRRFAETMKKPPTGR